MPSAARELTTDGPGATRKLAARLGRLVIAGDVIALRGDLGAGKTCFVKGLAKGLQVSGDVHSPTFNIVVEHGGRLPLFHVDLYRILDADELVEIGLDSYLYGAGVCAVEWMDRFPSLAPRERLEVAIELAGARRRTLRFIGHGTRGRALAQALLE